MGLLYSAKSRSMAGESSCYAAQKTGFLYVFDRETGEPVWPIEERSPTPIGCARGTFVTDPALFPPKPAPFAQIGITEDDLIDFTPEIRERALAIADSFVFGSIFTPPLS
ncbi:MAG: hypothetical protein Ct9H300mP15_13930 [Gemmatimonadota bacterium]|nr:MAG: hypothetical protein Ct9H300mP15_13930 [Gemmatimonadota bacterium]